MTDYNNGQIWGWNSGDCPVHPETEVRYWLRRARDVCETTAKDLRWSHIDSGGDIIAFQVVKAHFEPKVIWVNECATSKSVWDSEADAKKFAMHATRIAVKYVEVKE